MCLKKTILVGIFCFPHFGYCQDKMALSGHSSAINHVALSADGQLILSSSIAGRGIKVWEVKTGDLLLAVPEACFGCFLSDNSTMAVASLTRDIDFWNIPKHRRINGKSIHLGNRGANIMALHPNGKILACGIPTNGIKILDLETAKEGPFLKGPKDFPFPTTLSMCFSRDGQFLAAGGAKGFLAVWDTKNWQIQHDFSTPGHPKDYIALALSPDGKTLVSSRHARAEVFTWDMAKGQMMEQLKMPRNTEWPHLGIVNGLAFSPDGQTLALASYCHGLALYDVQEKKMKNVLSSNPLVFEDFHCVAFFPDGKKLVTGSVAPVARNLVKLWEMPK